MLPTDHPGGRGENGITVTHLADHPAALVPLAGWLHRQWLFAWGLSREQAEDELQARSNRASLPMAWVALAAGRPVGTVSLVEDELPFEPGQVCCLAGVYVLPAWRGQSLGRRLCMRALSEAERLGFASTGLYTRDQEPFYRRLGWVKVTDAIIECGRGPELVSFMEWRRRGSNPRLIST
jgi:predicted N-acetyltransferase YhbS